MFTVKKRRVTLDEGRVGLISDTHGLLRPEALAALKGSEVIIHAGDIGKPEVLTSLTSLAPVMAIRGNNDRGSWAQKIPDILHLEVNGAWLFLIHNVNDLEVDAAAEGFNAVISGHSHKPGITKQDGMMFLNPGSAGPRRFRLPIALARLRIRGGKVKGKIVELL